MKMRQVIPTSVCGLWADNTLLCRVVAVGDVGWSTANHTYTSDTEHWFVKDALTNIHGLLSQTETLTVSLIAHSSSQAAPSDDVKQAAAMAASQATCRLTDEARLEAGDWVFGNPSIPGATIHYFFQDPSDDGPDKVRIGFATNANDPNALLAIVWFAKASVDGYSPGSFLTLTHVPPGPNGQYPGTGTIYHHRTNPI